MNYTKKCCLELALNKEMMKQLEEENFDVGLAEGWNYSLFANFHLLKIPATIATSVQSIWPIMENIYGLPHPSNVPGSFCSKLNIIANSRLINPTPLGKDRRIGIKKQ